MDEFRIKIKMKSFSVDKKKKLDFLTAFIEKYLTSFTH